MSVQTIHVAPYTGTAPYMFISYAHKDADRVLPLLSRLNDEGYRFWYDSGIEAGENWSNAIASHVQQCDVFVVFVSRNSMASEHCLDEIAFAKSYNKRSLMIFLEENVSVPAGTELHTSRFQRLFFTDNADTDTIINKMNAASILAPCRGDAPPVAPIKSPVAAPAPVPSVKRSSKKWGLIAVAAILAIAVFIGVFAFIGNDFSHTEPSSSDTASTSPSGEPTIGNDPVPESELITASLKDLTALKADCDFIEETKTDIFGNQYDILHYFYMSYLSRENTAMWKLDGKYTHFSCDVTFFDAFPIDSAVDLAFYADDEMIHYAPNVADSSEVYSVSLDVSYADKLTIKAKYFGNGEAHLALVNTKLDNTPSDKEPPSAEPSSSVTLNQLDAVKQAYAFTEFPAYDMFGNLYNDYYNFGLDWVTNRTDSVWRLNKEYATFSCDISFFDEKNTDATAMAFYADDRLMHFEPDLSNQSHVRHVSFDVTNASTLTVKLTYNGGGEASVTMVNAVLEKVSEEMPPSENEVTAHTTLNDLTAVEFNGNYVDFPAYDAFGELHVDQYRFGADWANRHNTSTWMLNGEYTTFSFDVTAFDENDDYDDLVIEMYADDRLIHTETGFSSDQSHMRHVSLDVSDAQALSLKVHYSGDYSNEIAIVNAILE